MEMWRIYEKIKIYMRLWLFWENVKKMMNQHKFYEKVTIVWQILFLRKREEFMKKYKNVVEIIKTSTKCEKIINL